MAIDAIIYTFVHICETCLPIRENTVIQCIPSMKILIYVMAKEHFWQKSDEGRLVI